MKISTRSVTVAATLTALCAVFGFIPYVFFLPVTVAAAILPLGMATFVGLAFGCISLAYSFIMPTSLVATAFISAPYVAILPRILAALCCGLSFKLLHKLFSPKTRGGMVALNAVGAGLGSLYNTAFVVGLMALALPQLDFGGVTVLAYVPVMLISGAIEFACMAVLNPPIVLTLKKTVFKTLSPRKPVQQIEQSQEQEQEQGQDQAQERGVDIGQ